MSREFLLSKTFDELSVGDRQVTRARTITEADVVAWCALTGDWFRLHSDKEYAATTAFGERIAPGLMVLAFSSGLGVPPDSETIVANYGMDRVRYTKAVPIGATVHATIEVTEKNERDADTGIVVLQWQILDQHGDVVSVRTMRVILTKARQAAA